MNSHIRTLATQKGTLRRENGAGDRIEEILGPCNKQTIQQYRDHTNIFFQLVSSLQNSVCLLGYEKPKGKFQELGTMLTFKRLRSPLDNQGEREGWSGRRGKGWERERERNPGFLISPDLMPFCFPDSSFYWQLNTQGLVLDDSFSSSAPHNVISAHSISDADDCAGD